MRPRTRRGSTRDHTAASSAPRRRPAPGDRSDRRPSSSIVADVDADPPAPPPALPRSLGTSGKLWLAALAVLLVWAVVSLVSTPVAAAHRPRRQRHPAPHRTAAAPGGSRTLARAVDRLGSGWTVTLVMLGMLVALMVFRRWRHLLTFLGSLAVLEMATSSLYDSFARPRPYGVTIIGRWAGYSLPSPPVAVLAAVLIGVIYTLVVPGPPPHDRQVRHRPDAGRPSPCPASTWRSTTPSTSSPARRSASPSRSPRSGSSRRTRSSR